MEYFRSKKETWFPLLWNVNFIAGFRKKFERWMTHHIAYIEIKWFSLKKVCTSLIISCVFFFLFSFSLADRTRERTVFFSAVSAKTPMEQKSKWLRQKCNISRYYFTFFPFAVEFFYHNFCLQCVNMSMIIQTLYRHVCVCVCVFER